MKKIVLHIGTMKTGSTTLQNFFASNEQVLLDHGILYPRAGRPSTLPVEGLGHHALAWAIRRQRGITHERCWSELLDELSASDAETALVSTEAFGSLDDDHVEVVRGHLAEYEVKVVVYLRSYFDFLKSCYIEELKRRTVLAAGGRREAARYYGAFRPFIDKKCGVCDYVQLLLRWSNSFSKENVCARIFDKVKGHPRLCQDFLEFLGISPDTFAGEYSEPRNVSPSAQVVTPFRVLNWFESSRAGRLVPRLLDETRDSIRHQRTAGRLMSWVATMLLPGEELGCRANRDHLAEHVSSWNEELRAEWLPSEDVGYLVAGLPALSEGVNRFDHSDHRGAARTGSST